MAGLIFVGFLAMVGVVVLSKALKIVGQAEVLVVERLGRFHRVARSGLNVLVPFVERPRAIDVRYAEADVGGVKRIALRLTLIALAAALVAGAAERGACRSTPVG